MAALAASVLRRFAPCLCPHGTCADDAHFQSTNDLADALGESRKSRYLGTAVAAAIPSCRKARAGGRDDRVQGYYGIVTFRQRVSEAALT